MASRLNPYLNFDGNAREAMEFYQSVFGGDLVANSYADFGNPDPALAGRLMHAQLETPAGFTLMGADFMPDWEFKRGNSYHVSLSGDDGEELRGYWARLCEGAEVSQELEKQVWGDEFGALKDRFGVEWLINIGTPQG